MNPMAVALAKQAQVRRSQEAQSVEGLITAVRLQRAAGGFVQPFTPGQIPGIPGQPSPSGYGAQLPRDGDEFRPYGFGPGTPIQPTPIDTPDPITGRPRPRRSQYPISFNLPIGVPGSEGLKLVSFQVLRAYAEANSLVRACIEIRKNEILGFDYDIVPTRDAAKAMQGNPDALAEFEGRRKVALAWWARPDPDFDSFHSWFSAVLEAAFVDDAVAVYLWPSTVPGMGLFGTDLSALSLIDGSTVRPVLDARGGTPTAPNVAYQQYLWGVPRVDMTDIINNDDINDMDEVNSDEQYTRDQLLYLRLVPRVWTPYGFPPTERCILSTVTYLKRQELGLEYFTEGTIPAAWLMIGGEINATVAAAKNWQDNLNAMAGDTAYKQKLRVLPQGSTVKEHQESRFDEGALRAIQDDILMTFDVKPTEVGLSMGGSKMGLGGKGMAEEHDNIHTRTTTKPLLKALDRGLFNYILQQVCGQTDMEWKWIGMDPVEDELQKANVDKIYASIGVKAVDEIRGDLGLAAWNLPMTQGPIVITATGPVPLGTEPPGFLEGMDQAGATGADAIEVDDATRAAMDASGLMQPELLAVDQNQVAQAAALAQQQAVAAAQAAGTAAGGAVASDAAVNRAAGAALWGTLESELRKLSDHMCAGNDPLTFKSRVISHAALEAASRAYGGTG